MKRIKDVNKLNETIAGISGRNPDELIKKKWAEYCMTAQVAYEMYDKKKK